MIEGVVIQLPAIVKSSIDRYGDRIVEVEASVEQVDSEGDMILQRALLDSAASFIAHGHLDIDHYSELGEKLGIKNPSSFIVGKPIAVKDIGATRTSVVGRITKAANGVHDPRKNRFDAFWDTFHSEPPIKWRASVYGFPKSGQIVDCSENVCEGGAWRYLIKGLDWRSLAFTRTPVNDAIKGHAKIVMAKAFMHDLAKGVPFGEPLSDGAQYSELPAARGATMSQPRNLIDAIGQYHAHIGKSCPQAAGINSTIGFRDHFIHCCGMDRELANVYGHALMHHVLLERRRTKNF